MNWIHSAIHALPITVFLLGLTYYWFAVADRYAVFLYEHLGATPFDAVTGSRYWMAGLIANGFVLVLYTATMWLLSRVAATRQIAYTPPDWRRIWLLCALPLVAGVLWITMTQNAPTLPIGLALATVASTLVGLALALWPGRWAAERPTDLLLLMADGLGVALMLFTVRLVEWPTHELLTPGISYTVAVAGVVLAGVWLAMMTIFRRWWGKSMPGAGALLAIGFSLTYLLFPLIHHLLATPPDYKYISTSSNFFGFSLGIQMLTCAIAALVTVLITWTRSKIGRVGGNLV